MKKIFIDKNGVLRIGWTFFIAILLMYIPLVLIFSLGGLIFGNNQTAQQLLWGIIGTPTVIFLTTILLKKFFKKEQYLSFDYFQKSTLKKFALGFLLGIVLISSQVLVLILGGQMKISYQGIEIIRLFAGFATFTGMAVLEECVFRGLADTACQKLKWPLAILTSAIFFTFSHQDVWMNFSILRITELFLSAILFTLITRVTKSITLSTGVHLAFNYFGAVILGVDSKSSLFYTVPTNGHNIWTGIDGGGSIVGIIIVILFIIGFTLYGHKKKTL